MLVVVLGLASSFLPIVFPPVPLEFYISSLLLNGNTPPVDWNIQCLWSKWYTSKGVWNISTLFSIHVTITSDIYMSDYNGWFLNSINTLHVFAALGHQIVSTLLNGGIIHLCRTCIGRDQWEDRGKFAQFLDPWPLELMISPQCGR